MESEAVGLWSGVAGALVTQAANLVIARWRGKREDRHAATIEADVAFGHLLDVTKELRQDTIDMRREMAQLRRDLAEERDKRLRAEAEVRKLREDVQVLRAIVPDLTAKAAGQPPRGSDRGSL